MGQYGPGHRVQSQAVPGGLHLVRDLDHVARFQQVPGCALVSLGHAAFPDRKVAQDEDKLNDTDA